MQAFVHDKLKFRYTEQGTGLPFLFQHGLGGSLEQPTGIFTPPSGIRLISFDFRGHGESEMGPGEMLGFHTFADDMAAFLCHLHIEEAVVGGISMGAGAALNFAVRYPEHTLGLVLVRPAWLDHAMEKEIRDMFHLLALLIREDGAKTACGRFMASELYRHLSLKYPRTAQSFLKQFQYEQVEKTAVKFERIPDDAPTQDRTVWRNIKVPAMVLANSLDPIHPLAYGRQYAAQIPKAEFQELTAKETNEELHNREVQTHIVKFFRKYFLV